MRILVADDDALTRRMVARTLARDGHEVLQAADGAEALELVGRLQPDLLVTDYRMPGLDGIALTRRLKALGGIRYVPVLMLTSGDQPAVLRESLEAGALEYLQKPFQPDELRWRVGALAQLALMHNDLARRNAETMDEVQLVKFMLGRLLEESQAALPEGFVMETLQTERINGDACACRECLPGVHFGLLCDATGHGLMAGIITIPVVETFLKMVQRDLPLEVIYREINAKLCRLLPTSHFACLLLLRLDAAKGTLSVLNAGMPGAVLRTGQGIRAFRSRNLPAGIHGDPLAVAVEETRVEPGDLVFAYSDGLEELTTEEDACAVLFGAGADLAERVARFRAGLAAGVGDAERVDDVSWALWSIPGPPALVPAQGAAPSKPEAVDPGLGMTFELHAETMDLDSMLPSLLRSLAENQVRPDALNTLSVALGEALRNAVDHGLLGLAEHVPQAPQGAFHAQRQACANRAAGGMIQLRLKLFYARPRSAGLDRIRVEVTDSGPGFDWRAWVEADPGPSAGRGLAMIRGLCENLQFNDAGNKITFEVPCR